jgi:hypothetical protein
MNDYAPEEIDVEDFVPLVDTLPRFGFLGDTSIVH